MSATKKFISLAIAAILATSVFSQPVEAHSGHGPDEGASAAVSEEWPAGPADEEGAGDGMGDEGVNESGEGLDEVDVDAGDEHMFDTFDTPPLHGLSDEDFVEIDDADGLLEIGEDDGPPLSGRYILTGDIALTDEWTPIGSAEEPFTGVFDGGGHKISGLRIESTEDGVGFFGFLGDGAEIRNLSLEAVLVMGGDGVGALAGISGAAKFENCFVAAGEAIEPDGDSGGDGGEGDGNGDAPPSDGGEPAAPRVEGGSRVGGLVGSVVGRAVFEGCGATIDVHSDDGWAGGLVGYVRGASPSARAFVRNSYATGDVWAWSGHAGGLAGGMENAGVESSLASGNARTFIGGSGGIAYIAAVSSSIRNTVSANKHLAVFAQHSRSNTVTTQTPASSLSGNIHYSYMAYTPYNDLTDRGEPKSIAGLRAQGTYAALGWDFENVWDWDGVHGSPRLRGSAHPPADILGLSEDAPRMTSEPFAFPRLFAGETLVLETEAEGPDLLYQWYRDGVPLEDSPPPPEPPDPSDAPPPDDPEDSDAETISGANTAILTIENIEPRPASVYVLMVANAYGETASNRIVASVSNVASMPTIILQPRGQEAGDGHRATFSVIAVNNRGEVLSYRWERADDPDGPWSPIPRSASSTYTTPVLQMADDGTWYRCIVTNTLGHTSKTAITVAAGLKVFRSIRSVKISEASITMSVGEKMQLEAICLPEADGRDDSIIWNIATGSMSVSVNIGTGEVEAIRPGTATVVAMAASDTDISEICFIRVVESGGAAPLPNENDDGTPKLPVRAVNIHSMSSEGTPFMVLPSDRGAYDSIKVVGATPAPASGIFEVDATGAPSCRVVAKGVPKGRYALELRAQKGGVDIGGVFMLTANVKDAMPKAKVRLPSLNTFYTDAAGFISISGTDIPAVERIEPVASTKAADGDISQNFGVYDDGEGFVLYAKEVFGSLLKNGKPAVKGQLHLWYRGFDEPYRVNVTIPAKPRAPKAGFTKATRRIDPDNGLSVDFVFAGADILNAEPRDPARFAQKFDSYGFDADSVTLSMNHAVVYNENERVRNPIANKTHSVHMNIWLDGAREPLVRKAGIRVLKPSTRPRFTLSSKTVTINKRC